MFNNLPNINWLEHLARQSLALLDGNGLICTNVKPEVSAYITWTNVFRRRDLYKLLDDRRTNVNLHENKKMREFYVLLVYCAWFRRHRFRRQKKTLVNVSPWLTLQFWLFTEYLWKDKTIESTRLNFCRTNAQKVKRNKFERRNNGTNWDKSNQVLK